MHGIAKKRKKMETKGKNKEGKLKSRVLFEINESLGDIQNYERELKEFTYHLNDKGEEMVGRTLSVICCTGRPYLFYGACEDLQKAISYLSNSGEPTKRNGKQVATNKYANKQEKVYCIAAL